MSVKEQYWKYSLITIILGLGLILFIKMSPFMGGILGACTIYIMVRKQMFYLTQEKHFKKSITAILLLIEAIMCFLVPLSLAVWLLINKLQTVNVDTTGFIHTVTNLADWLHTKTGYDLLSTENIFMPYKICNHIIGHQFNARVCFNFLCFRHCIHLIGYTIFKKRFQILEQTESVHRIYR